jgi:hypothetical protein
MSTLADVGAYERAANPDQVNIYGFIGLSAECAAELPPEVGPPSCSGMVDSHRYVVAIMPDAALSRCPPTWSSEDRGCSTCRACPAARRARVQNS